MHEPHFVLFIWSVLAFNNFVRQTSLKNREHLRLLYSSIIHTDFQSNGAEIYFEYILNVINMTHTHNADESFNGHAIPIERR